jgi:hypothetical protein
MKLSEAIAWFDDVARLETDGIGEGIGVLMHEGTLEADTIEAAKWMAQAESAINAAFPVGHSIRSRWDAIVGSYDSDQYRSAAEHLTASGTVLAARGVFNAAHEMLRDGRLGTLFDGVRAETVVELLDQAEALLAKGWVAAATVIAGGALENHLRHLCTRSKCVPPGPGSINAYRDELAKQRTSNNEIISAADGDLVGAWGKMRNSAAHDPVQFVPSDPRAVAGLRKDIELMVKGIRLLVARTEST